MGAYSLLLLFGDTLKRTFNAFALSGRDCSNTWDPGCRFACPGLGAFGLSARALSAKKHAEKIVDFEHPTLQGATAPTRDTQGVASLALGYVLHWAFSPPLLNSKLEAK